jgi:hypothetical protein
VNAGIPVWPLFVFGGVLTVIAAGIFVAIFVSARNEAKEQKG